MKIYCMGDSITFGSGLKDPSKRFSDLVAQDTGCEMINCGIGGDTTTGMLSRLHAQVFSQKPDALVFFGGVNDINLIGEYRIPCANLVSVIVQAKSFGVPVFVGVPLPIEPKDMPVRAWDTDRDYDRTKWLLKKYAHFITHFCEGRADVHVVDFRTPFLNEHGDARRELFVDGIHPNEAGHRIMADILGAEIKKAFSL